MEFSQRQNLKGKPSASSGVNIVFQYLIWHFFEVPKEILKGWGNFLKFNLNYFSIPLLFQTLFSYWRQYRWSYGRGFDLKRWLEAFFSNLVSRILGAIVRTCLIIIGLLVEIFLFFGGLILFLVWIFFPVILIVGLFYGFQLLL